MSEGRVHLYILILVLAAVLIIISFYAVRYMDVFNISAVVVSGMDNIPSSVSAILAGCYGVNRFTLDEGKVKERIEANALVDSCSLSYSFPARLNVALVPTSESVMLYDGTSFYLMSDGRPVALESADLSLADALCTLEVSPTFISYMQRYCAPTSFDSILTLVAQVNAIYGRLITRIKYDNNTTDGFGQIVLSLDALNCELYVRERVSFQRISESIGVIQASIDSDPAGGLSLGTWRWDLYSDALVRRMVEHNG